MILEKGYSNLLTMLYSRKAAKWDTEIVRSCGEAISQIAHISSNTNE